MQTADGDHHHARADEPHEWMGHRSSDREEREQGADVANGHPHTDAEEFVGAMSYRSAELAAEIEWGAVGDRNGGGRRIRRVKTRKCEGHDGEATCGEHPSGTKPRESVAEEGRGDIRIILRRASARRGVPSGL